MQKLTLLLIILLVSCTVADPSDILIEGAKVEKCAGGFKFTEGPACDHQGNVLFTDIPNNKIFKWSFSDKKLIKQEFKEKGRKVIKIEEHTIPMPNICEKCHERGIPRIERKSNRINYHYI